MNSSKLLTASTTTLFTLTLAACGGGGGGGGGSTPTPQQTSSSSSSVSSSVTSSAASSSSAVSSSSISSASTSSNSSSAIALSCSSLRSATLPLSSVTINSTTRFSAYGVLELSTSSSVDSNSLLVCLKDKRSAATESDSLQSTKITDKGGNNYQVQLSRYQLPVEYELSLYWGTPTTYARATLAADTNSRVAFISTSKGTGDLASWTADTSDTPLQAADAVCTADANAAGLAGNYKAFLSTSQTDAICRLQGVDGLASNNCSPASTTPGQATAPFLDMKGLPIAYGVDDIKQGLWRLPVGYDVKAKRHKVQATMTAAWTGSVTAGTAKTSHCSNWSSAAADKSGIASGGVGFSIPNDTFTFGCDESRELLCFSATNTPWPLSQTHKRSGKLAWVQETKSNLVLAEADAACVQSKPSGIANAVAWFSDANSDALCRLIGDGGKIDSNCGSSAINWNLGPWVRADGYAVANTLNDLTRVDSNDPTPGVLAPILLSADATFNKPQITGESVRTDTYSSGLPPIQNNSCILGDRFSTDSTWTYSGNVACSNISTIRTFVYCFEK